MKCHKKILRLLIYDIVVRVAQVAGQWHKALYIRWRGIDKLKIFYVYDDDCDEPLHEIRSKAFHSIDKIENVILFPFLQFKNTHYFQNVFFSPVESLFMIWVLKRWNWKYTIHFPVCISHWCRAMNCERCFKKI